MSNQAEFLKLYLANESAIKAFLHSLVRDPRDFDDVYQTVVMRLLEKFDRYDHERPFGPWARGVAAKELLAFRRDQYRCPIPFSPDVVMRLHDAFEERLAARSGDSQEALEQCLQSLPDESRQLLSLRYRESLSMSSIAERIGRTMAATQRAISRLRTRLAECVQLRLSVVADPLKSEG